MAFPKLKTLQPGLDPSAGAPTRRGVGCAGPTSVRKFRGRPAGRRARPRWASCPRREPRPGRAAAHHLRAGRAPSRLPRPAGCAPDRAVRPPPRHPRV